MPKMHLKQHGFTKKKTIQKSRETWNSRYTCRSELDKASIHHDMVYGDFKDLPRRTASDKVPKYFVIFHSKSTWAFINVGLH